MEMPKMSIHLLAMNGKEKEIEEELKQRPNRSNEKNYSGWTPLHLASDCGHVKLVEVLVRYGADMNIQNDCGKTPLHLASWKGRDAVAELLVRLGADINIREKYGRTVMEFRPEIRDIIDKCRWMVRGPYLMLVEGHLSASNRDENGHVVKYLMNDMLMREICTFLF